MVLTHLSSNILSSNILSSNILLTLVPLMPTFPLAEALCCHHLRRSHQLPWRG
jgi:hypothetical protein